MNKASPLPLGLHCAFPLELSYLNSGSWDKKGAFLFSFTFFFFLRGLQDLIYFLKRTGSTAWRQNHSLVWEPLGKTSLWPAVICRAADLNLQPERRRSWGASECRFPGPPWPWPHRGGMGTEPDGVRHADLRLQTKPWEEALPCHLGHYACDLVQLLHQNILGQVHSPLGHPGLCFLLESYFSPYRTAINRTEHLISGRAYKEGC